MRIARVFPRRTVATPDDPLAFTTAPGLMPPEVDEVHISVAFTYDIPQGEWLAEQWRALGVPVKLGGPAYNESGGEFVPGRYLKPGYVITSRGCPNRCWFCGVTAREGYRLRELPITDGHNILDDNLLACSESHIRAVFAMLARQEKRPTFTGGLEARLLKPWHVDLIRQAKTQRLYMAYDTPDDRDPLFTAGQMLRDGGINKSSHKAACYVLIGYPGDTLTAAEKRLRDAWAAGFVPYAMLYRDGDGVTSLDWRRFQRAWVRPEAVISNLTQEV